MNRVAAVTTAAFLALASIATPACSRDRATPPAGAASGSEPAPAAPALDVPTVAPAELAAVLAAPSGDKPLLLQVGFRRMYQQGHIPGSEYVGPTNEDAGLDRLRARVASLPKDASIVLYCGCCPWSHCPNVHPAYAALAQQGFTHVKVLLIEHNFGDDWAARGYPVATGD